MFERLGSKANSKPPTLFPLAQIVELLNSTHFKGKSEETVFAKVKKRVSFYKFRAKSIRNHCHFSKKKLTTLKWYII